MKVPYKELKAKASKGPYSSEMNSSYQDIRSSDDTMRASVYGWDDDEHCTAEVRDANAQLIAHTLNTYDALLDSVEEYRRSCRKGSSIWNEVAKEAMFKALKDAQTVEVPDAI